jgi:ADP-ribose pyrophosphatase YjhB (NUDIX family)
MTEDEVHGNHKNPVPAVDVLIAKDHNSKILLVRRKSDPFKGRLSIPGGFINEGETSENAMTREAKEETSLVVEPIAILGVYSDPQRDPGRRQLRVHLKVTILPFGQPRRKKQIKLYQSNQLKGSSCNTNVIIY